MHPGRWVDDSRAPLVTDLYELTMLQSYFEQGMRDVAVFDLFVRRLPPNRNFLVACGLDDVLAYLENLRFPPEAIEALGKLGRFPRNFLQMLAELRFTGDVRAVPEGTVVFENEPILEVIAPLPEAQLVETFVMNQIQLQTMIASKAARVVCAAQGRAVVDFGLRRMHGTDAGMKAARAMYVAGVQATSNVLAGIVYGIPVAGTMAHSYVQAHDSELEAFRRFTRTFPDTFLLVDTYDTIEGIRNVIRLARELGSSFRVRGVRLDSGDLVALGRQARRLLDEAGLSGVELFASGGLDEYEVERLVRECPEYRGFGVGTRMGVSDDAPYLDIAYKLVEYAGRPRMKRSESKSNLPGRKQIFRQKHGDVIAQEGENLEGEALLVTVMKGGTRCYRESIHEARERAKRSLEALPKELLALRKAAHPYPVSISSGTRRLVQVVPLCSLNETEWNNLDEPPCSTT